MWVPSPYNMVNWPQRIEHSHPPRARVFKKDSDHGCVCFHVRAGHPKTLSSSFFMEVPCSPNSGIQSWTTRRLGQYLSPNLSVSLSTPCVVVHRATVCAHTGGEHQLRLRPPGRRPESCALARGGRPVCLLLRRSLVHTSQSSCG